MNLQKNDKIILVVGVVILIAAAGAIAIYTTQSNGDDEDLSNQAGQMMTYDVISTLKTRTLDSKTYTLNLPSIFSLLNKGKSASDDDCFKIDMDNIKSIEINVSYTDSKMGLPLLGLLGQGRLNIGKDQLTVKIIDPDGIEHKIMITGNGKEKINIEGKFISVPQTIEEKSFEEANNKLEEYYSTEWTGVSFELKGTLKIAERLNLLSRIFERFIFKDTFKIDITCSYYEYTLEEIMEEDNQDNNDDEYKETGVGDFYNRWLWYGGQMI